MSGIYPSRVAIAVVLSLLAAPSALAQETIKVGVTQPLTGVLSASGTYVTNGARLAAEHINEAGGVLGKKIELVIEDNKSNPSEAAETAEKLIVRDKVSVLLGAWASPLTLAVMPKLIEYQVPLVVETSTADKITTSSNPWVFRTAPTVAIEATKFGKALPKFKIKKADLLVVNTDWGRGAASAYSKVLTEQGLKVGLKEYFDPAAQDFTAELAKIKASGSDTLFVTTEVRQVILILKQAQTLGLPQQIITTGGSQSPDQLVQQAGDAANNTYHVVIFVPWFPEQAAYPDVTLKFISAWNKKGYDPVGLSQGFRGYDGITTIAAALKLAGKAEPDAIREALWKVKVKGVNGEIAFKKDGPAGKESGQADPNVYIVAIKDGKIVLPSY